MNLSETIIHCEEQWQDDEIGVLAKFCAQWDETDWTEFITRCQNSDLDIDAECVRMYEEQGDF